MFFFALILTEKMDWEEEPVKNSMAWIFKIFHLQIMIMFELRFQ